MQNSSAPHRKALPDNYRSAFGVVLLMLLSLFSQAQTIQYPNPGLYGTGQHRGAWDSTLYIPTGCGVPSGRSGLQSVGFFGGGQKLNQSALFFDSCGHNLYVYDPSVGDTSWTIVGSGGGGSGTVTSVLVSNDSLYYLTASSKVYVAMIITQPDSMVLYVTPTQLNAAINTATTLTVNRGLHPVGNTRIVDGDIAGLPHDSAIYKNFSNAWPYTLDSMGGIFKVNFTSDQIGDVWVRNASGFMQAIHPGTTGYALISNGSASLPTYQPVSGAVASVSNSDNSISFSPNTGAVVGSLNMGNPNLWAANQTLNGVDLLFNTNGFSTIGNSTNAASAMYSHQYNSNGAWAATATGSSNAMTFGVNAATRLTLLTTGQAQLNTYGVGTFTGTPAYSISEDATGHLIETTYGGGGGSPSGPANSVQTYATSSTFGSVVNFTANASTHVVNSDTLSAHKVILDSARFSLNLIPKARLAPIIWIDNSYGAATGATLTDSGYAYRVRDSMNVPINNYSLGSTGVFYYAQIANQYVNGPFNSNVLYIGSSFNDIRAASGTDQRTYNKQAGMITSLFVLQFATRYISASDITSSTTSQITNTGHVTRYGTWTVGQNAAQYGGKMVGGAAFTSTANDSVVYQGFGPAFGINMIAGDGNLFVHSTIGVYVDEVLYRTVDLDSIADGKTVNSHVDSRVPYGIVIAGLTNTFHSIKLINTQAHYMYVDYFTALDPNKPSYIVSNVPQPATVTISATYVNKMNTVVDSVFATLPSNYPAFTYPVNDFFHYEQGQGYSDSVHPDNAGHQAIMQSFVHTWDSISSNLPNTMYTDSIGNLWVLSKTRGAVRETDFINSNNIGSNQANFNGNINIPNGSNIQQGGYNLIQTDSINNNLYVGPGTNSLEVLNTSQYNVMIGPEAGWRQSLYYNTAVGAWALRGGTSGTATAQSEVAIGYSALRTTTAGQHDVAVGTQAMYFQNGTTEGDNVALGYDALGGVNGSSTAVLRQTVIGSGADLNATTASKSFIAEYNAWQNDSAGTNDIVICYSCTATSGTPSNQLDFNNFVLGTFAGAPSGSTAQGGTFGLGKYPNYMFDNNGRWGLNTDSTTWLADVPSTGTVLIADSNTSTGAAAVKNPMIKRVPMADGSFTCTPSNTLNVSAATVTDAYYVQHGQIVTVTVSGSVTTTTALLNSQITLTLPISTAQTGAHTYGPGTVVNSGTSPSQYSPAIVQLNNSTSVILFFAATSTAGNSVFTTTFQYHL